MYEYRAEVINVVDADTLDLDIDLGFWIVMRRRVRLLGVDTFEVRGDEKELGVRARSAVQAALGFVAGEKPPRVRIVTVLDRSDKYGRILATVWCDTLGQVSLNDWLIAEGHGVATDITGHPI